jgi:hypothetical protein
MTTSDRPQLEEPRLAAKRRGCRRLLTPFLGMGGKKASLLTDLPIYLFVADPDNHWRSERKKTILARSP